MPSGTAHALRRCPAGCIVRMSGSSSAVERQLPKLDVTGSIPVSRSIFCRRLPLAAWRMLCCIASGITPDLRRLANLTSHQAQGISCGGLFALRAVAVARNDGGVAFSRSQEKVSLQPMLFRVELVVAPARGIEFFMRAAFDNLALFHHQNLIGASNSRQAVSDYERSASLHQVRKALLDHFLRF